MTNAINDFIFRGSVAELDPELKRLLDLEDERQASTIILIASESEAPEAVNEALGSSFGNIYAEGYPREESRQQSEAEILDVAAELAHYRRYSDPRYYKGVEYADLLEALARRRAAELFAANGITADNLFVNVQPLSGGPANSAVYTALLQPGDTIMGLNLNDGGHLSHGATVNRSGQVYKSVPYFVSPESEVLDYDAIEKQVLEVKPQIIVAGYSAYPLIVDWQRFRQMANQVGAYLLADISHISGLVAAGVHPSPIGIADVVMTTTHKSLCGPRGAMLLTHRRDLVRKLDRAVFPGEQGGPHLNTMAALAVALKLAQSEQFRTLQQRIVDHASRLAEQLQGHGLRVVGGGSQNHLLMVDTKSVAGGKGQVAGGRWQGGAGRRVLRDIAGVHLSGDMAARILDMAGIVVNRNTIPGDKGALSPTGIRIGTVWISQLGFGAAEIDLLAEAIATVLKGCSPFAYTGPGEKQQLRAKADYGALLRGREIVRQLRGRTAKAVTTNLALMIRGTEAATFLNYALTSDVLGLGDGESQATHVFAPELDASGVLTRLAADRFYLSLRDSQAVQQVANWLQALSDGYVDFGDLYAKLPGPIVIESSSQRLEDLVETPREVLAGTYADCKPFFIGQEQRPAAGDTLPTFSWEEPTDAPLKRTSLYETHKALGAKLIPFAGYDMPVWYTSVGEEHAAVRQAAGLFDVSHMGVFEASGPTAAEFLNVVTTNDVTTLAIGESQYSYFLLPDGGVVDDLMVYRRGEDRFMVVVNASNNDKNWAWLNGVNEGRVLIDAERPFARLLHPATLRDLRDPQHGEACRVDIALQGPRATDILLALGADPALAARIKALPWAGLAEGTLGGFDLIISRTGYTGERVAYELFVHPDKAPELWQTLLKVGEAFGLKSCGLASRDSTRTEAGLPLYGHELAGDQGLNPAEAGFGSFVKTWKPFFVGRAAFLAKEEKRDRTIVRFRMNEKAVRRPETGDPILDRRGKIVGTVTSCAIDSEGYLLGQAIVLFSFSEPGGSLYIYQLGGGQRPLPVAGQIAVGGRLPVPDGATVLTRFPSRKKK